MKFEIDLGAVERALSFWVPGHARTKGSLDLIPGKRCTCCSACKGHVGMPQARDSANSKRWRELVAYQARAAVAACAPASGSPLIARDRRVSVHLGFAVPVADVIASGAGDLDKLYRNVLDALQDARVYEDDVQVVWLSGGKVEAQPGAAGIMRVEIWAA